MIVQHMSPEHSFVSTLSVVVQFAVVATLFVYFVLLRRTVRLEELRLWSAAWFADALALAAILLIALPNRLQPPLGVILPLYLGGKTAFAILMVAGARNHVRPAAPLARPLPLTVLVAIWSIGIGSLASRIAIAQFAQCAMVAVVLAAGGWVVLKRPRSNISRWLGLAFVLQSSVFAVHALLLAPTLAGASVRFPLLDYASFIDAWLELVLALSCLAAIADRSEEQLRWANNELLESQDRLSLLVDTDPLTKLANRRAMRPFMDRATLTGAVLVFIDINDFKLVNDRFGHAVGDAVLQRLARLLRETFRPQDAVMRYGGDEFLVIAPDVAQDRVKPRIDHIRSLVAVPGDGVPGVALAIGVTELGAGGDPAAALVRADHLMYHDKPGNH